MIFSASSIKQWRACQRQWGRERIDKVRGPQSPKAALGTRCHEIAEAHLRDGIALNMIERVEVAGRTYYPGRIVSRILGHLPPAGTVPDVERRFDMELGGHELVGCVDWQTADVVGDHKFTSALAFAMDKAELAVDPQAILYAESKFRTTDASSIELRWVYGQFDAKVARKVSLRVLRDPEPAKTLLPDLDAMAAAAQTVTDAKSLPKSLSACDAFGGCTHKTWCGPHSSSEIAKQMFARLPRAKPVEGRSQQMASITIQEIIARRKAAAAAAAGAAAGAGAGATAAGAINPPGEHLPTAPAVDEKQLSLPTAPVAEAPVVEAPAPEAPRKRGRPAKAKTTAPLAATGGKAELTLFVDCVAVRGEYNVVDVISSANEVVCQELSTPEREISHYSFVDYGKGSGALAIAAVAICDEMVEDFAIELSTRTPQGSACAVALLARATNVIRGA